MDTLERWAGEEATYDGRVSFGWDECLPSVTRCPDPLRPDGPPLRDHGDQWGRPCEVVVDDTAPAIITTWPSPRWPITFQRRLSVAGDGVLRADYTITTRTAVRVPVLWAAHPALQLEPGTRIELPGVADARIVGVLGWPIATGEKVPWPVPTRGQDLSLVRPIEAGGAVKLYASTTLARARAPDGSTLTVEADGELVRTMGVWLDAGGWPPEGVPVHQTAFEPTSSPDDQVADALAHERAWLVRPGGSLRWWISFRLEGGEGP
jgi:galactose mutarotase-like enzyme